MTRGRTDTHRFWRDPALPFLEARAVDDGCRVSYGLHSHPGFSIGAVTGGRSDYCIADARYAVGAGAIVLMNPDVAHACNPVRDLPWSYRMLHVDAGWLAGVQADLGGAASFTPYACDLSTDPALFRRLNHLFDTLFDDAPDAAAKERAARTFFAGLHRRLARKPRAADAHRGLERAAAFIRAHCTEPLPLADICAACGLSPSYLVRAFKARYGLTPHAYQIDRRIRFGRAELRRGRPIVDVALEAGFADQAHFQRAFKRHVAATPGQYAPPARPG